jgi:hypothetical protein
MTNDPGVAGYFAADAEAADEFARLRLIEAAFDPHTFRHLDAIRVGAGWRCLEVRTTARARWCVGFLNGWALKGGSLLPILIRGFLAIFASPTSRCAGATSRVPTLSQPTTTWSTVGCS